MTAETVRGSVPFAEFYELFHGRLRGFAVDAWGAGDADDIAQEAMARALSAYDRLDPSRDPWPWLVAVAKNIARDHQRRHRVITWVGLDSDEVAEMVAADSPHDAAADVEQRRLLRRALGRIAPADREVLLLRECHDVTFEELSLRYGRSQNALRQQAFRARRRLADEFTALGGRALGAGTALAARWWRLRARAERVAEAAFALPAVAQVATAAVAGAIVVAGGTAVTTAPFPRTTPAAYSRLEAGAVTPPIAGRTTRVAAAAPARDRHDGPAASSSARRDVTVRNEVGAAPGGKDVHRESEVVVDLGFERVGLRSGGWSDDQGNVLCSSPTAVRCQ